MKKISTKAMAESVLRELPSVLGAFVREDVFGHPREVHLLVTSGHPVRHLARDVRSLLQERLGVPVDQRVISIAQLSERADVLAFAASEPAPPLPAAGAAQAAPPPAAGVTPDASPRVGTPPPSAPGAPAGSAMATRATGTAAAAGKKPEGPGEPRLIYQGLESVTRNGQVQVRVRLARDGEEIVGEGSEVDGGAGRMRAAASATLRAVSAACESRLRADLEAVSVARALGQEYVVVEVAAAAQRLGRHPVPLSGAHPLAGDGETAAALAALHACNRVVAALLRV